jgi:CRP/FNR family cyclic AMP-dependent transcriptional regulator
MLAALPSDGRMQVLAASDRRTFGKGQVLVRQGEDAVTLFIVESGRVRVHLLGPEGDALTLTVLGPGDVFGEMGLVLPGHQRTANAEALDDVVLWVLRKEQCDRLRARHPEANDFLLQLLARRVDRLSRHLLEAYHLSVDQRVARRLLEVGRLFAGGSPPVVLPLTQEDLAQMAGTTRPTANQVLQRLQSDGIVRLVRGRVELLDVPGLRRRC